MNAQPFILKTDNARLRMKAAWDACCKILELGQSVRVTVSELKATRTIEQNDKFHAICADLSKKRKWSGKARTTEGWKRLLVDAWARAEKREQGEIVPSLDGESVVNLGLQTRHMKVKDMSDLIEFAQWWCADHDVELSR